MLIVRFSALGDIAMIAPVVRAYAEVSPQTTFTIATAPMMAPFFQRIPNLRFEAVNTKAYEGVWGIIRLFRRLHRLRPHLFLDQHQVLRTYILCFLFFLSGLPVFAIKKGRWQKSMLTRQRHKRLQPLPSMISKYRDTFVRAGFPSLPIDEVPHIRKIAAEQRESRNIGIAPFAKHEAKAWPAEKMEQLIERLSLNGQFSIFLFGANNEEQTILKAWEQRYRHVRCMAGVGDFAIELSVIGIMDLLVSMDSANMHFASFMEIPVISIWGGTHPFAGFYGWRQDPNNVIQIQLACRPCSVFGNKRCRFGTLACLQEITVEEVFQKISLFFNR